MFRHRFAAPLNASGPAVGPQPAAFVACPLALVGPGADWRQELYRRAYEEARAVVRPSLPERLSRSLTN